MAAHKVPPFFIMRIKNRDANKITSPSSYANKFSVSINFSHVLLKVLFTKANHSITLTALKSDASIHCDDFKFITATWVAFFILTRSSSL